MKKLLFLLVPFMVLLIDINSYAYNAPDGGNYKYYYTFTTPETSSTYATTYELWSDAKFGMVYTGNLYYLGTLIKDSNGNYKVTTYQGNNNYKLPYAESNNGYSPNTFGTPDYSMLKQPQARLTVRGSSSPLSVGRVLTVIASNQALANNAGIVTYNSYQAEYEALYSDYLNNLYDWDNPYYSVAVAVPEFNVTYRNIVYNEPDVPLNVNIDISQQSTLYAEVMAEYTLPTNLQYRYSSNSFESSQYTRISKTIVTPQEMVLANTLTASGLYSVLKNKWAECLNELPLSSVSIRFPQDFSAQEILDARSIYDELRQVCTNGGTAVKIYIRYFTIENNSQFVVGAWRIWNSTNPKTFGVELPSWYKPYIPASGETGTNPTTDSDPDVVVIPSGGQTPTGQYYDPSINITVGNNVPNYPDYPTIATYNLDNMLVDTMNNARSLSSFFGEFGGFIQSVFVFLPSWIWAIIGVGFSLSIVVMFLKIL